MAQQTPLASTTDPRPDQLRSPSEHTGLDISIRTGSGTGRTLLSAFDHALQSAGVADFNLVTLSSVIPPGSRLRHVSNTLPGGHGDLLFCVRAEAYAEHSGDIAWAGLGWCVDETGGGLFVEHHGPSEESVAEQIELSLGDMNHKRGGGYGPVQMALASAHSTGLPTCAVVVAAYRVSSWFEDDDKPADAGSPAVAAEPDSTSARHPAAAYNGMANGLAYGVANGVANGLEPPHRVGEGPLVSPRLSSEVVASLAGSSAAPVVADIRVTVEKELDYAAARYYYELYRDTFGQMETQAVARQLLHESEFIEEMLDSRVMKYVAWSADGEAIGLTTLTRDLATVPWISPAYFAHHYPDHHARDAIFYLGFTLVHPDHQGAQIFKAMIATVLQDVLPLQPVVAWDICLVNDKRGLGGAAGRLLTSLCDLTLVQVDQQNYYAGTFHGPLQ
ncbi:pyruvoyl-dependent arginine decarboxylase [Nocardioides dilutus]